MTPPLSMDLVLEAANAIEDRAELLAILRVVEWSGSAGRCPSCSEWPATGPTDGLGNPTHEGHDTDCKLAALLGRLK